MKETISYLIKVKNFCERQCQENGKIDHRLGENFLQKTQLINSYANIHTTFKTPQ